jgi:5-deoxy-glucuronate isomerase
MKYFASLESKAGLNALPHNPCKLLGFDLLVLPAGKQYTGDTGDREVLAVILGGKATFEVAGKRFEKVGGRPNVFAGKPHSVYLPAAVEYAVTADGPVQVAMTSAPGYMTYYLWFLAGEHRTQATTDDPTLGWVSRTVPMLKELGF